MIKKLVLGDKILIKPEAKEEKVGKIFIPESAVEKPQKGVIIASGPESDTKTGDEILYNKNAVAEIEYEGDKFLFGADSAVVFILREE